MKKIFLYLKTIVLGAIFFLFSCTNNDVLDNTQKDAESAKSEITQQEAISIAKQFIDAQKLFSSLGTRSADYALEVVYTDLKDKNATRSSEESSDANPAYYVINVGENGYIIVSGSDVTLPVLGYSDESTFDPENIPFNMKGVLADFKSEIEYARKMNMQSTSVTSAIRDQYLNNYYRAYTSSVAPLLGTIKWDQMPYYNAYCPPRCPVGCVATATSQIMRYWEYPASGTGTFSYNAGTHGTLSFDYNYTLNWNRMPRERLTGKNLEVARFCYGVAVGVKMSFSPQGSGAYQFDVPALLRDHYRYPNTMQNLYRRNYSTKNWETILRRELDARRPIQYAGHGSGGGHSFVCDGYNANGYFHFNWGWGGQSDGYFLTNALNPGSLGTGGGTGGFNSGQTIVIGIQPPR